MPTATTLQDLYHDGELLNLRPGLAASGKIKQNLSFLPELQINTHTLA
jgi:hypothetical protein